MWGVDSPCPEFRIRTPSGAVGPGDLRGSWVALLHCTRPCTPGCCACLDHFGKLGERLAERGCRLIVALDEPDRLLRERLGQMRADAEAQLIIGTWETPEPKHGAATVFAVIDPRSTVRELTQGPNMRPLSEGAVLEAVDRALGRPVAAHDWTVSSADPFGCVEWFDYDVDRSHLHDAR